MEILKKIGKFVIAPIVFLLGALLLIKEYLIGDGIDEEVDNTRKKDVQLKEKADKAEAKAETHKEKADEIAKKRDDIDGDPDWDV